MHGYIQNVIVSQANIRLMVFMFFESFLERKKPYIMEKIGMVIRNSLNS